MNIAQPIISREDRPASHVEARDIQQPHNKLIERFQKLYLQSERNSNNQLLLRMYSESNLTICQPFNPNQTINLKSFTKHSVASSKNNALTRINLAQKINLKNHVNIPHTRKKGSKGIQNGKNNVRVKLQPMQTIFYSESLSNPTPPLVPNKVIKPPSQVQNSKFKQVANMKIQHQMNQPIKVNPMQKIQLGPKIQNSTTQQSLLFNPKKYKIRVLNSDFTSMRYECFCSRQYLSYCAAYHHLKKDHHDFLKQNRRFSFTNVFQTTHPVYGYKIKKIMRERLKCLKGQSNQQIQTLGKQTKQRIKTQSPQIQKLIKELSGVDRQRKQQVQMLKLLQRKLMKAGELVDEYQKMIFNFQKIFHVLNIKQICQKLDNGPTVLEEESNPQDEDYFPQ